MLLLYDYSRKKFYKGEEVLKTNQLRVSNTPGSCTSPFQLEYPHPTRCCRRWQGKFSQSSELTFLGSPVLHFQLRLSHRLSHAKAMVHQQGLSCSGPTPQGGRGPTCHPHSLGGCSKEGGGVSELLGQNTSVVAVLWYHCFKNHSKSLPDFLFDTCILVFFKWHISSNLSLDLVL